MKLPNNTLLLADLMQLSQVLRPAPYGIEEANFNAEHRLNFETKHPVAAAFSAEDLSVKPLAATGVNPKPVKGKNFCVKLCTGCTFDACKSITFF